MKKKTCTWLTCTGTPQSMLFSCCGMSFGVFVKKYQFFASKLLFTCCSTCSFYILAMESTTDGFVKDPALMSETRTRFSLKQQQQQQEGTSNGLGLDYMEQCFVTRPFRFRRSLIGLLSNHFSNASHAKVSMFRPLESVVVVMSCKYASITKLVG